MVLLKTTIHNCGKVIRSRIHKRLVYEQERFCVYMYIQYSLRLISTKTQKLWRCYVMMPDVRLSIVLNAKT
jgi:hypothetical protein